MLLFATNVLASSDRKEMLKQIAENCKIIANQYTNDYSNRYIDYEIDENQRREVFMHYYALCINEKTPSALDKMDDSDERINRLNRNF